jgi:hypothetical protein
VAATTLWRAGIGGAIKSAGLEVTASTTGFMESVLVKVRRERSAQSDPVALHVEQTGKADRPLFAAESDDDSASISFSARSGSSDA